MVLRTRHKGPDQPSSPQNPERRQRRWSVAVTNGRAIRTHTNGHGPVEGMLHFLPAGSTPPDAGEFVGTKVLGDILDRLAERADVVIIDAPPLLHVGDAMTLSAHVDALFVVTRLNVVRRPMLAEMRRVLHSSPAARLGFVLTGAGQEDGYGYGGYSGYYQQRGPEETEPAKEHVA